jgi:hypothetical protein
MSTPQVLALALNALTVLICTCSVFLVRATRYYNDQTARNLAGLPDEPKPLTVRIADRLMGDVR